MGNEIDEEAGPVHLQIKDKNKNEEVNISIGESEDTHGHIKHKKVTISSKNGKTTRTEETQIGPMKITKETVIKKN